MHKIKYYSVYNLLLKKNVYMRKLIIVIIIIRWQILISLLLDVCTFFNIYNLIIKYNKYEYLNQI